MPKPLLRHNDNCVPGGDEAKDYLFRNCCGNKSLIFSIVQILLDFNRATGGNISTEPIRVGYVWFNWSRKIEPRLRGTDRYQSHPSHKKRNEATAGNYMLADSPGLCGPTVLMVVRLGYASRTSGNGYSSAHLKQKHNPVSPGNRRQKGIREIGGQCNDARVCTNRHCQIHSAQR